MLHGGDLTGTAGACDGMRLLREGGAELFARRATLQSFGGKVKVWYALNDTIAPAHHGEYISKLLPEAQIFPRSGGHLGMFLDLNPFLDEILSKH